MTSKQKTNRLIKDEKLVTLKFISFNGVASRIVQKRYQKKEVLIKETKHSEASKE